MPIASAPSETSPTMIWKRRRSASRISLLLPTCSIVPSGSRAEASSSTAWSSWPIASRQAVVPRAPSSSCA